MLPEDIHVFSVEKVSDEFHARFNAKKKTYKYIINCGEYNPIERNYVYQLGKELNIDKMNEALEYIKGEHDFNLLSSNEHEEKNTIRTIYKAKIAKKEKDLGKIWIFII